MSEVVPGLCCPYGEGMRRATVLQSLMSAPWRFWFSRWPWLALGYLLISAALGVVLLPITAVTFLLLPLWALVVGALERRRTRLLGFGAQASGHVPIDSDQRQNWLAVRVSEAATWREVLALLVDLVVGVIAVAVLFAEGLGVVILVGIGVAAAGRATHLVLLGNLPAELGPRDWWLTIPILLLALAVAAYVNALLAAGQASTLRLLCAPRNGELSRNVERLTQSRATLVEAFESERRRIERDLHDGVQQELVTIAARLGLASLELDELEERGTSTGELRDALDSALDQTEHALATLRDTVRGIHPAVLTDQGLASALEELTTRTPVPVALDLDDLPRMPAAVETAAYYLATEAITNAAKHASATRVRIAAHVAGDGLVVTVTDDGQGGAAESGGTGLRGLRERAETLGGILDIMSPLGGPTTLRMSVPTTTREASGRAPAAR